MIEGGYILGEKNKNKINDNNKNKNEIKWSEMKNWSSGPLEFDLKT